MTVAIDHKPGLICTYSGERFDPLNPDPDQIHIEDIAHGLSNVCRYGGQCKEFFSVGQHSLLVSQYVSEENALWGLLHDAPEAYIGDIVAPLKYLPEFSFYMEAEDRLMDAIAEKFGLPSNMPKEVKEFDLIVRETEMRDFGVVPEDLRGNYPTLDKKIIPFEPKFIEQVFLYRFHELML